MPARCWTHCKAQPHEISEQLAARSDCALERAAREQHGGHRSGPRSTLQACADKITTAAKAVALMRAGEHVFVGTACATPRSLVAALEAHRPWPADVELLHFLTDHAVAPDATGQPQTNFRHRSFFVGQDMRAAVRQGLADHVPISLARVPKLMAIGRIPVDVALIQVSMPDEFGYVSLGLSVDVIPAAVARARLVIALRCGADDRQALEQLCRTITRPPCRPELCEGAACKVVAAGIHAAAGCAGATAQAALDPFGVRVTSLREVSSPRCANHGVLAPNAKLRALVVPQEPEPPAQAAPPAECEATCAHLRPFRLSWAKLLKRVLAAT